MLLLKVATEHIERGNQPPAHMAPEGEQQVLRQIDRIDRMTSNQVTPPIDHA